MNLIRVKNQSCNILDGCLKITSLLIKHFSMLILLVSLLGYTQIATSREEYVPLKTYEFSDPNPIPDISRIYPYYKFQGYTTDGYEKNWKMVVLENDYIKVFVCPDIGGKVWGAIEKSTGKEFLYFNKSAKFRSISIRGPWTSGGIEFNFGTIGHTPNCATPVDYTTKTNYDGSLSCIVGSYDLTSRTRWNVEISLEPDKAYFKTKTSWYNLSELPTSYYHWMNAAAKSSGNLQFLYPGTNYIGHDGEVGQFPIEYDRDISFYNKNNFGSYKSYHVLNTHTNFFGGYWHDEQFGFGRYSLYDEKPGKKIWIWGLSDQGMIWEDLLTDSDGQYIEWQSGKLFNQAATKSTQTPFKHQEFLPGESDVMEEYWFPIKDIGNVVASSPLGLMNLIEKDQGYEILICPLQKIDEEIKVIIDGNNVYSKNLILKPLETNSIDVVATKGDNVSVRIGGDKLVYISDSKDLKRPLELDEPFNWDSAYGNYVRAKELEAQRNYAEAEKYYNKSLGIEKTYLPSLSRLALSYYRKMDYDQALTYATKALAINTYDPEGNYIYGLVNKRLNNKYDALSGFSIAVSSPLYRSSSFYEMAKIHFIAKEYNKALNYLEKSLSSNSNNYNALKIEAIIHRILENYSDARSTLSKIEDRDATDNFSGFEEYLINPNDRNLRAFKQITNTEFPAQNFIELALFYYDLDLVDEAIKVLEASPKDVIVSYWLSYFYRNQGDTSQSNFSLSSAIEVNPEFVFPFRHETVHVLEKSLSERKHWKTLYYLGLIHWHLNSIEKAKDYFEACKMDPDFAPFYLARASLFSGEKAKNQKDLEKAHEIDPLNWRVNIRLSEFFISNENKEKGLDFAKKAFELNATNSEAIVHLAKSLLGQEDYLACLKLLEEHTLIPYEGFSEGRAIYHDASIKQAYSYLNQGRFDRAIDFANKSREWPKNIGVGKPYHVDERMADFITALAKEMENKLDEADYYYRRVIDYEVEETNSDTITLLVQLVATQKLQSSSKINGVQKLLDKVQVSNSLDWVKKVFEDYSRTDKTVVDKISIVNRILFDFPKR